MFDRIVSHDRAKKAAMRLINSHFDNNRETHPHARTTIPVHWDDDDVTIMDYIAQQKAMATPQSGQEGAGEQVKGEREAGEKR